MYDVIVVGARCAGATTAMLLARAGHRVLLVDRDAFPSDQMSTHYVHQPAIARLDSWGLLDQLKATGCPPLDLARWRLNGLVLEGCAPAVNGIRSAFGPRRYVLDALLVRAAVEAGVELRERCNVTGVVWDEGRVTGIRFTSSRDKSELTEHARLVVGADGVRSTIAEQVGAKRYDEYPTMSCVYYTYWSGLPSDYEVYVNERRAIGVVPTNDDLTMVAIGWPRDNFAGVRGDVAGEYRRAIQLAAPDFYERVAAAERVERFVGTGYLPNFFREAAGPGWALVGDAGYHKDPAGAYGITDAFKHAELLSQAIDDGLTGRVDPADALAGYASERDRSSEPAYYFNLEMARWELTPELLNVLRFASGDQVQVDRFFGMIAGILTPQEFMTEELVAKAVAANGSNAEE